MENLLDKIKAISKKYELINQKTGGYFNIFEITNISTDEVAICRVLYELLSPSGSHYQGNIYLKLFIENVLKLNLTDKELLTAKVHREYVIDYGRRIDIVIETVDKLIPIEVKIYAEDQENQCYDYYQKARNSKVYYLTRFGDSPSKNSTGELTYVEGNYLEIINISFSNHILNWLNKCLGQKETIVIAPIREIMLQFSSVIHKFTNQIEDDKEMEIKKVLMASPENMSIGIEIEKSLKNCKISMIEKIFKAIEVGINKEKLENEYDYRYNDSQKTNNYYNNKSSTYPGISYLYKKDIKEGVDVWVRIEIDHRIFIGYCVVKNNKSGKQILTDNEIRNYINVEPCVDNWWAYWEYVPDDMETKCPNFKDFNDAYIDLFDQEKFEEFIGSSVSKTNKLLKSPTLLIIN